MADFSIKRSFAWIQRAFRIIDKTDTPSAIGDRINIYSDVFGWDRLQKLELGAFVGGGPVTVVPSSVVPQDEVWYISAADAFHDEGISHSVTLEVGDAGGTTVSLLPGVSRPALRKFALDRPFVLWPGATISAVSDTTIGAGSSLFLQFWFVRLDIGEYIPGTP